MSTQFAAAIVVPSFNRPDRLRGCLAALSALEGGPYDIIVVDDGSSEPLEPVCREFGGLARCLRQDNAGPAAARNAGAAVAQADFLAFTDDDCRPDRGWLLALMSRQQSMDARLVGGRVVNLLPDNIYASASQSLCDYLYDYFGADDGNMPFFTSNNIGCARVGFESLGGFDVTFPLAAAEDRDFGLRWRAHGGELVYAPQAVVGHAHNLTLKAFLRQHANYGQGARHLHKLMDDRGDSRPKLESLRFYMGLAAYPLGRPGRARLTQAALLMLSQAAMVAGYARRAGS